MPVLVIFLLIIFVSHLLNVAKTESDANDQLFATLSISLIVQYAKLGFLKIKKSRLSTQLDHSRI